jgi:hypothetical protein
VALGVLKPAMTQKVKVVETHSPCVW